MKALYNKLMNAPWWNYAPIALAVCYAILTGLCIYQYAFAEGLLFTVLVNAGASVIWYVIHKMKV